MKTDYITLLPTIGLELLSPFTRAKDHHDVRCTTCNHEWSITPLGKRQAYEKYGHNGCPVCYTKRKDDLYRPLRDSYLAKQPDYIQVLSEYDGQQGKGNAKIKMDHVHFRNTECGHEFWCIPTDIFNRRVICPTCGTKAKRDKLNARNEQSQLTLDERWDFVSYKRRVTRFTNITKKLHMNVINPENKLLAKAGVDGAHHIDHIFPQKLAHRLKIPPELVAHVDNLQVLSWEENLKLKHKLKDQPIPQIIQDYLTEHNISLDDIR